MIQFFSEIFKYKTVVMQLIHQQITMRYRRTVFGFLWTLLNPLFNMAVIAFVFSMVMKFQVRDYAIFLLSAMIPWMSFSNSLHQSAMSLIANESLFKKIYLPKQIFVVSAVISTLIDSILSTICLFVIALFLGAKLALPLIFLPISFLILSVFTFGLCFIFSVFSVYFRDTQYLIGVVLQAMYFATPIIYPITAIPEKYHFLFYWNPMFYFIDLFRSVIYEAQYPNIDNIVICSVMALVSLLVGVWVFIKNSNEIIFRL